MAFKRQRINKICTFGGATMEAPENSLWFYKTEDDAIAVAAAANYFDAMIGKDMKVGDLIKIWATDAIADKKVTAVSPHVIVA